MPQKNPNNPEKDFLRQIGQLAHRRPQDPPLPRPERAVRYLERGSWNWMGEARVIWCWWAYLWGRPQERSESRQSLVDWYRRQEREGHMLGEAWTASHFELYIGIGAGGRVLSRLTGDAELLDLSAAWWCRQEALATVSWVAQDGKGGNTLLPHARAGHGGVSQGAAVAHQLLRGLPLGPFTKTKNPDWWANEDMLGCLILRELLAEGDTFTVEGHFSGAVPAGVSARVVTVEQLLSTAPLLLNPVRVERRGDAYRAVMEELLGGMDPCLWIAWDAERGRQVHGDGKPKPPTPTTPPPLAGEGPITAYLLGPNGWIRESGPPMPIPAMPIATHPPVPLPGRKDESHMPTVKKRGVGFRPGTVAGWEAVGGTDVKRIAVDLSAHPWPRQQPALEGRNADDFVAYLKRYCGGDRSVMQGRAPIGYYNEDYHVNVKALRAAFAAPTGSRPEGLLGSLDEFDGEPTPEEAHDLALTHPRNKHGVIYRFFFEGEGKPPEPEPEPEPKPEPVPPGLPVPPVTPPPSVPPATPPATPPALSPLEVRVEELRAEVVRITNSADHPLVALARALVNDQTWGATRVFAIAALRLYRAAVARLERPYTRQGQS